MKVTFERKMHYAFAAALFVFMLLISMVPALAAEPVAKINDTEYDTLQDAFEAASQSTLDEESSRDNPVEIVLLRNIELSEAITTPDFGAAKNR